MVRRNSDVVGKIVPGMQVEIIGDQGQSLNSGMFGKVRLKSPGMISGYIDNAAETKRVFRKGWFYPGDLAEFTAGGALVHHGRADELMILDGINIYPAEIENALLGHEAVAEAAAFPLSTVTRGDVPVAVVATKSNVSVDEMLVHCRSSLGTHAPRRLKIVPELPRKTLGKVLKNELSALFLRRRAKTRSVGRRGRGKQIGKGA
jgi:acyl-coenzyme A synthetase/AMP-(fatty) acid ligase